MIGAAIREGQLSRVDRASPRETVLEALAAQRRRLATYSMAKAFERDPERAPRLSMGVGSLRLDYSKNLIDDEAMTWLVDLARTCGVTQRRDAMMRGDSINETEVRPVLHVAARASRGTATSPRSLPRHVARERLRMFRFADVVRSGLVRGSGGMAFTDIVNIGIGGSDLGPVMVARALAPYADGPALHFVSNVDGAHILEVLSKLRPETTLVIISSKSFSTRETQLNAKTAIAWLVDALGTDAVARHVCAVTGNARAAVALGMAQDRVFPIWDWIGGRFSVWSAIGLPVAMAIGSSNFKAFLAGAREMDMHFVQAPLERNMPIIMALLQVWYRNFWNCQSAAVIPYEQRLEHLPAYLQQLAMESNGKRVRLDGLAVSGDTAAIVWGGAGTNGQHAYFQFLHQGTTMVPCDFLVAAEPHHSIAEHHVELVSNCIAQSQALMRGYSLQSALVDLIAAGCSPQEAARLAPHKVLPGNRPSNTLIYRRLDPRTLGMLIALYEHRTMVEGVIWGINSFDQWGVELGKRTADKVRAAVTGASSTTGSDSSTRMLIDIVRFAMDRSSDSAADRDTTAGAMQRHRVVRRRIALRRPAGSVEQRGAALGVVSC